ncbi:MAG TPA: PP2C family protein-serine/threonine phosphatase [Terriglobales bacterium]|nr:PP2C family protein-serine/threonine phosphatase [Terriglobales bacterium]
MAVAVSATSSQPVTPASKEDLGGRFHQFWQRVTEGLELNQLWTQFQADARASYRLYSREVDATRTQGVPKGRHWFDVAKQFFWAILEKLSPARRVLLLLALVLIIVNPQFIWHDREGVTQIINLDFRLWGGLLMFVLLVLEVADRVVMKRDLQIAREIQMWLLPANPPQVPGLEIAFATRPANTVAGDYYDVFPRASSPAANQNYLLAVADVAGKSIPAALLMATFQASLKTLSTTPCSLAELVNGMNRYACTNSQSGLRFTTAFLAEYDPGSRTLAYINAGHNTPILRRASGKIERLEAGGLPLGIQEPAVYQSGSIALESGDWLVIFTDGLVEAVNDRDEEYGEQRVLSVLQAGASTAPAKLLSKIMVDLDLYVGNTPQHDDVTCMLVRANAP